MTSAEFTRLPKLNDLPKGDHTATVKLLLEICHRQQEQLAEQSQQLEAQAEPLSLQGEQIRQLKDEVAVLKGEKARPKIKPKEKKGRGGKGKGRGKPSRKKTAELEIHDKHVIEPDEIPPVAVFKGYVGALANELLQTHKQGIFQLTLRDNKKAALLRLSDNKLTLSDNSLQTATSAQIR